MSLKTGEGWNGMKGERRVDKEQTREQEGRYGQRFTFLLSMQYKGLILFSGMSNFVDQKVSLVFNNEGCSP